MLKDAGDWNAGAGSVPAEAWEGSFSANLPGPALFPQGFVAYLEEFDESLHNATAVETARRCPY